MLELPPERAKQLGTRAFPNVGPLGDAVVLNRQSTRYVGPLPVIRVASVDNPRAIFLVSPVDGRVTRSSPFTPLRRIVASMHDFTLVALVTGGTLAHRLLVVSALAALGLVVTGYYLAIRTRKT
jgi:hypothetical protein